MRSVIAVGAVALSACAYHPGSFHKPNQDFRGERATIGCLDLSIDRRVDRQVAEEELVDYEKSAVFEYSFGNRCNQPTTIDLASVAVWATTASGEQIRLYPYDPQHVIAALPIEGRLFGSEVIAYPLHEPATRVCIDAASIARVEPAQWKCFESKEPAVIAEGAP